VNPRGNVRSNMVNGALTLLATRGVEGTSFKEVLDIANAPRGSVYHHFPGGKAELLHSALDRASGRALDAMEATRGLSAPEVLERFLALWRALLDYSQLRAGCAVVSVTVAGADGDVLDHAGTIFRTWTDRLAELFVVGGMDDGAAHAIATVTIAATEGAVVLTRAEKSMAPFNEVANTLTDLVRGQI
jgi:AcrR family transcriptional regulator